MIDLIFKVLQTLINKENNGYISPVEFNSVAHLVQEEIFRGYWPDENTLKTKQGRAELSSGYASLAYNLRQKIDRFAVTSSLVKNSGTGMYPLPEDLYFIEDKGITSNVGRVIEEIERASIGYASLTLAAPSEVYPVYELIGDSLRVLPATISTNITCRYVRKPKKPLWTYIPGTELFNPSASNYQDFELHPSEFTNIVNKMLMSFGLSVREDEVMKVAQALDDKLILKESR